MILKLGAPNIGGHMLTGSREDYIKAVYLNNEAHKKTTNKELSDLFGISPASVSEMMKKLISLGHIEKDSILGFKLKDTIRTEAQNLIRKHRLWEVFFVEKLKLNWADVHQDAEILEHATSDLIADGLNEFLGYPQYCPHGSVIYGNGGSDNLVALSLLKEGQSGTLIKVKDSKELLAYLEHNQLHLNTHFMITKVENYEGNVHLRIDSRDVAISYKAAQDLYIGDIS